MKKYLMTGVAAVAMCAAFTSCSKDSENYSYNPEQIAQNEFEARLTKYKESFVNNFGQPAANQTWGFGVGETRGAMTRANIDVNGNLEKYENCPTLGPTEEADVVNYVTNLSVKPKVAPTGLVNYFVTQVHCGTETYGNADGGNGIVGSAHMDHLMIAMQSSATISDGVLSGDWEHINNFNRGDNTDWKGNTLVENGGTFNFAYNGSEDSKYHDRWIAIDGANIDAKYAGYYYVCFDFEGSMPGKTVIKFRDANNNPQQGYVEGAWDRTLGIDQVMGKTAYVDVYDYTTNTTTTQTWTVGEEGTTEWQLDNVLNGNMIVQPNSSYLDWIVRLVKAQPKEVEPAKDVVRVIAEDMAGYSADDFDFNDVVFDCELDADKNVTNITLVHTGAEFSITVDGVEVHEAFGLPKNTNRPQYWTMGSGSYSFKPSKTYKVGEIPVIATQIVEVKKEDGTIEYKSKEITLDAPTGMTTGKIAVRPDFGIVPERQNIDTYTNKKFSQYVQNGGQWDTWYK